MAVRPGLVGLLQIADSAFPVGGFAHSDGIEALAALGILRDVSTLEAVLVAHRRLTLDSCDAWFVRSAHGAVAGRDAGALGLCARGDLAARAVAVTREASLALGQALLRAAGAVLDGEAEETVGWAVRVLDGRAPRATSFGAVAAAAGATVDDAAGAYGWTVLSGMASAAVRLGLVGSIPAQGALRRALAEPPAVVPDAGWTALSPLLDIAAMRHETLAPRLFSS